MEWICPIRESSDFICGDPAGCLVNGVAICAKHAQRLELAMALTSDGGVAFSPRGLLDPPGVCSNDG